MPALIMLVELLAIITELFMMLVTFTFNPVGIFFWVLLFLLRLFV